MLRKYTKTSATLLGLLILWCSTTTLGRTCELSEADSIEYSLQEDNRCEGVQSQIEVSGSLDLVSFTSSTGGSLNGTLLIRIPRFYRRKPFFQMMENSSRYVLNNVPFLPQNTFYSYKLPTNRLKQNGIKRIEALHAIAVSGTQRVYLPTLLGNPTNSYRFVFYSVDHVRFVKAQILRGEDVYASWGAQGSRRGPKAFEWEGAKNAPAGRYEFFYIAEIEQGKHPPERIVRRISFEHNPKLLK